MKKKGSCIFVKNIYSLNLKKVKELYESNLTDKNIIEMLGTSDIKRLKIGISKNNIELKNYVLSNFNKIEKEK